MTPPSSGALATTLQISRTFAVPREVVFRAWTEPEKLRQWWGVTEGHTAPIVEIDLRVGGQFRLGMKHAEQNLVFVVSGVYREVRPPEKLVYTWAWEPTLVADTGEVSPDAEVMMDPRETLVTVEFHQRSGATELVLTHEQFPDQSARDLHAEGWTGVLTQLGRAVEGGDS